MNVSDAHAEAQDLLPWIANGRLAGPELERVQAHLRTCAVCRAELAVLHTLRTAGPDDASDLDPGAALSRLLPQLDEPEAALPPAPPAPPQPLPKPGWRARLAANDARWLRVAVGAQCCVIAVLALLLARTPDGGGEDAYRLLGSGAATQGSLVVVFRPDTPERDIRRIVLDSGAQVVGGPMANGAWVLGGDADPAALATRLRAQAAVTLAEPLGAQGRP